MPNNRTAKVVAIARCMMSPILAARVERLCDIGPLPDDDIAYWIWRITSSTSTFRAGDG
jgi:hypothetical protein